MPVMFPELTALILECDAAGAVDSEHGSVKSYVGGCHCDQCRRANADAVASYRRLSKYHHEHRAERLAAMKRRHAANRTQILQNMKDRRKRAKA